jgi:hypothetical protein
MARKDQGAMARSAIFARLEREVDPEDDCHPTGAPNLIMAVARGLSARLNAAKARKRTRPQGEEARSPSPSCASDSSGESAR